MATFTNSVSMGGQGSAAHALGVPGVLPWLQTGLPTTIATEQGRVRRLYEA